MIKCRILKIGNGPSGIIAILEFSNQIIPKLRMILIGEDSSQWEVSGISMPILFSMTDGRLVSYYNTEAVWEAILKPVQGSAELGQGSELTVKDSG